MIDIRQPDFIDVKPTSINLSIQVRERKHRYSKMAPFPEEVDVFSGPHSKMKHLVDCYLKMLSNTDFSDEKATDTLLRSLLWTFCVFRSHEQIENDYIMYRLRSRLETLPVADPHDSVVCNCHSDNRLTDVLRLVRDGLERSTTSSTAERMRYGRQLEAALKDFTSSFLPHMKEEEEVFQPLLVKYFEYDELVSLKETITKQHERLGSGHAEKFCLETIQDADSKPDSDAAIISPKHFESMPPEIILLVFSYLRPPDLGRCAQVCSTWNDLVYHPSLWRCIFPAYWARGIWEGPYYTFYLECRTAPACEEIAGDNIPRLIQDEDEDVDERQEENDEDVDEWQEENDEDVGDWQEENGEDVGEWQEENDEYVGEWQEENHEDVDEWQEENGEDVDEWPEENDEYVGEWQEENGEDVDEWQEENEDEAVDDDEEFDEWQEVDDYDGRDVAYMTLYGPLCLPIRRRESVILDSMRRFVFPRMGFHIRHISFAGCRSLDGKQLIAALLQCPNVDHLDLSYTVIDYKNTPPVAVDLADGKEFRLLSRLVNLDLTGCSHLTNEDLKWLVTHLVDCFKLDRLSLSGCDQITDTGIRLLFDGNAMRPSLRYLDLSGCWNVTGAVLTTLVRQCSNLKPENVYYCDHILDGPYRETCNGCQNLESLIRSCCCT